MENVVLLQSHPCIKHPTGPGAEQESPKLVRGLEAKVEANVSYFALVAVKKSCNYLLLSRLIHEPISRMENAQIVHILHITLLKIQGQAESISEKMKCVQCFGLSLGDGWDIGASWKVEKSREAATRILDHCSFWIVCTCCSVEK
jgi:hypothetical protein